MMKRILKKLAPFLLTAPLGGVLYWCHDVYIYGARAEFAAAAAVSALLFAALLFLSGRAWPRVLGWTAAFLAVEQLPLALVNYVVFPAGTQPRFAMRTMLPLLVLLIVAALIKPWRALLPWKTRRWVVLPLAAAACIGGCAWAVTSLVPLREFVPAEEIPPAQAEKHSIADYRIIFPEENTTEQEVAAAGVLVNTLREISGEPFPGMRGTPTGDKEIIVKSVDSYGADGYAIRGEGESIIIEGGKRGLLYGAYKFLEKYFGCRWYTSGLIVIPKGEAAIAEVEDEQYTPAMEYREMDWLSRSDETYSVANGLNGNIYRTLPENLGGTFGYNGSFAHTIINQFLKPDEFFEAHPAWYAWREDQKARVPKQLCLTNPEVLDEMIREVRELLENGNGQPIISVTQDDNQDYCQCAQCKAVDEEEGSHAGTMIRFVNAIADDIKDDYPDAIIDTFAYQYTRTPPKHVKPLPNVIVRLCSIECCFAHPLDAKGCSYNEAFAKDIKAWSEICARLYIWDYTTNYGHFNCIFPNFGVLQENMRFFAAHNVRGVYEEGNYTSGESNSEFAELRGYLLARLLFNPDIDYDAEMNGFLKAYYGGGWQYMREFIDFTTANAGTKRPHRKLGIFNTPTDKDLLNLRPNQVAYADKLWAKAIELAGSEEHRQNVLRSQLCWRFWKGCNKAGEFSRLRLPRKWTAAHEALYSDFQAFGITRYSEGWSDTDFHWRFLPEPPAVWWGTPDTWRG